MPEGDWTVTGEVLLESAPPASFGTVTVEPDGVLRIAGGLVFAAQELIVAPGGEVIVETINRDGRVDGEWRGEGSTIEVEKLTVEAGGRLHGDGEGYTRGQGPGRSTSAGTGASHGGQGSGNNPASPYGNWLEPTDPGSASESHPISQSTGGGAIRLIVSGELRNDGIISANGGVHTSGSRGGGAGGSLWVDTHVLSGAGSFHAEGANEFNSSGGGGRIAIYYEQDGGFSGFATSSAGNGGRTSTDGSLAFIRRAGDGLHVTAYKNIALLPDMPLAFASLTIQPGSVFSLPDAGALSIEGNLQILSGGKLETGNEVSLLVGGDFVANEESEVVLGGASTLTVSGSLSVETAATATLKTNNNTGRVDGEWRAQGVTVSAGNLTLAEGGKIHADGEGYVTGRGPGGSAIIGSVTNYFVGGSHGGRGSISLAGPVYGSLLAPVEPGSGGGGHHGGSSQGGGAIRLEVSGILHNNGTVSANGWRSSSGNNAGGAGGSLWVRTQVLSGTGRFEVNGASGRNGDGGGGRVSIEYADASAFESWANVEAWGHEHGSVALVDTSGTDPVIRIDRSVAFVPGSTESFGHMRVEAGGEFIIPADTHLTVESVDIEEGGRLVLGGRSTLAAAGEVRVRAGAELIVAAVNRGGRVGGAWVGRGGVIEADAVVVEEGAAISADGEGYDTGRGPGMDANWAFAGASHGGRGRGRFTAQIMPIFGSMRQPVDLGSGGGASSGTFTRGGGAIRIVARHSVHVDGRISADGVSSGDAQSGASGGSVWIDTAVLAGDGHIHANAAEGGVSPTYGTSAGGRVAVYYDDASGFADLAQIRAEAGGPIGHPGTVYLLDRAHPGGALTVFETLRFYPDEHAAEGSVTVEPGGLVELGGGAVVRMDRLTVTEGAEVRFPGKDNGGRVFLEWIGRGATLIAGDLEVEAGAIIHADGLGYRNGNGPGTSIVVQTYSHGASHGGLGGGTPGLLYGSAERPVALGSASGVWDSSVAAGGALRLMVANDFQLDGRVSANAITHSGSWHSGASGGSIWISAGSLTGTGTIEANASPTGAIIPNSGSGGGRVAVYTVEAPEFPAANITVHPSESAGTAGTIRMLSASLLEWTSEPPDLLHGEVTFSWLARGMGTGRSVSLVARSAAGEFPLATSDEVLGEARVDTRALPNGHYRFTLVLRGPDGTVESEISRPHGVNNSLNWLGGTLDGDLVLGSGTVHAIESDLVVPAGVTLTLEAGAILKFIRGTGLIVAANGNLITEGTAEAPVILTSMLDDTVGGDSNRDGNASFPQGGDWRGLEVAANGTAVLTEFVELRHTRTVWQGTISGNIVWRADQTHYVHDHVNIASGSTLTIEPGAVIKMGFKREINFASGTTLIAEGTRERPIIFTSFRDHARGGRLAGIEDDSGPQAGDWRWLSFNGTTVRFKHTEIRYGGGTVNNNWSGTGVLFVASGSDVQIRNSVIADAFFDGIRGAGGNVLVENSLLLRIDRAVSLTGMRLTVLNSVFDDNRIAIHDHGGQSLNLHNTIISNSTNWGVHRDLGRSGMNVSHVIFWNPEATGGDIGGISTINEDIPIGSDGIVSADPRFVSAFRDNFRLRIGSPAIDAADGTLAPPTDSVGNPRVTDPRSPNNGVPTDSGAYADIGAYEFVDTAESAIDMVVTSVSAPPRVRVGEEADVSWTVGNTGSETARGPWADMVFLARQPVFDDSVVFLSEVMTAGEATLPPGGSVSGSTRFRLPPVSAGTWYLGVSTNSRGTVFEGANRENNIRFAPSPLRVEVDGVPPGETVHTQIRGMEPVLLRLDADFSSSPRLHLDWGPEGGRLHVYIAHGRVPTPEDNDGWWWFTNRSEADVVIPLHIARNGYLLIAPGNLSAVDRAVRVTLLEAELAVDLVVPGRAARATEVSYIVTGTGFGPATRFVIANGETRWEPEEIDLVDDTRAIVRFDTLALDPGVSNYDFIAIDGENELVYGGLFEVARAIDFGGGVSFEMKAPDALRAGRPAKIHIRVRNNNGFDVPAPLLKIVASEPAISGLLGRRSVQAVLPGGNSVELPEAVLAPLGSEGEMASMSVGAVDGEQQALLAMLNNQELPPWGVLGLFQELFKPVQPPTVFSTALLAIGDTHPAGILRAGQNTGFTIEVIPAVDTNRVTFSLFEMVGTPANPTTPDWSLVNSLRPMRPEGVSVPVWDLVLQNLQSDIDAERNDSPGDTDARALNRLLNRAATELSRVGIFEENAGRLIGMLLDRASLYGDLLRRQSIGPFGRGSLPLTPVLRSFGEADVDGRRLEFVATPFRVRAFLWDGESGRYLGLDRDRAEAEPWNGGHRVREPDGSEWRFDSLGRLTETRDPIGRAIRYIRVDNRIVAIEDDMAGRATLEYDGTGKVVALIDELGPTFTFSYAGDTLTRITDPFGNTTDITWVPAGNGPASHAPATLTSSSGARQSWQYDDYGRPASMADAEGATVLDFSYEGLLTTILTDSMGRSTRLRRDVRGTIVEAVSPEGDKRQIRLDEDNNIVRYSRSSGFLQTMEYDLFSNMTRFTNALGDSTGLSYRFGERSAYLISSPRGYTTHIEYAADPLHRIPTTFRLPDESTIHLETNEQARPVRYTNARGQTTHFEYSPEGRLLAVHAPDEPSLHYLYSEDGRYLEAIEERDGETLIGRTDLAYDAVGRLQQVSFPNSRSLSWERPAQGGSVFVQNAEGFRQQLILDSSGRPAEVRDGNGNLVVGYTFDPTGMPRTATLGNGMTSEFGNLGDPGGGRTVHRDASGNILYEFVDEIDTLGRVTARVTPEGTHRFRHDILGQLRSAEFTGGPHFTFRYDEDHNRVEETVDGTAIPYVADGLNRYVSRAGKPLTWDADGNLTAMEADGVQWNFHYNSANRMVRAESAGRVLVFEYDVFGNRSAIIDNGQRTELLHDPTAVGRLIAEYPSVNNPVFYYYGLGLVARAAPGGQRQFYLFDPDGNTVSLRDAGGAALNTYRWGLFGQALEHQESLPQPFGFGGRWGMRADPTGLIHAGARYLSPKLGRFTSRDPSFPPIGNTYHYTGNNPLGRIDFDGFRSSGSDTTVGQAVTDGVSYVGGAVDVVGAGVSAYAANAAKPMLQQSPVINSVSSTFGLNPTAASLQTNATKFSRAGTIFSAGGILTEIAGDITNEGGHMDRYMAGGDPYLGWDVTRTFARGALKALTMNNPLAGLGIDAAEWAVDKGSEAAFTAYFNHKYREPPPEDVFGEAYWRQRGESMDASVRRSVDPNEKVTSGAGPNSAVRAGDWIDYTIYFENLPTAELAAQEVTVEDFLSEHLDWSSLELIDIAFNDAEVTFPAGRSGIWTYTHVGWDPHPVEIRITLDETTGRLFTRLRSVDALTGGAPEDPLAGFLPPNDETRRGEGHLNFRIRVREDVPDDTEILNKATIVFDAEQAIVTNETLNIVDGAAPSSTVLPPTGAVYESFTVTWAGDDGRGAGINEFSIFVSVDGGPFETWLEAAVDTAAIFTGEVGRSYGFYSVARDRLGFIEATPTAAQATFVPVEQPNGYNEWAAGFFSAEEMADPALEDVLWGFFADPDGDGIPNGIEFYAGGNPLIDDAADLFRSDVEDGVLVIRIRRAPVESGLTLAGERSGAFTDWTGTGILQSVEIEHGVAWDVFRMSIQSDPVLFFRALLQP
ncbi:MAG: hypothetical protein JJU00_07285 [Opitutales bacterium]|nr:hypothetical protein [Opitutales bacterium]